MEPISLDREIRTSSPMTSRQMEAARNHARCALWRKHAGDGHGLGLALHARKEGTARVPRRRARAPGRRVKASADMASATAVFRISADQSVIGGMPGRAGAPYAKWRMGARFFAFDDGVRALRRVPCIACFISPRSTPASSMMRLTAPRIVVDVAGGRMLDLRDDSGAFRPSIRRPCLCRRHRCRAYYMTGTPLREFPRDIVRVAAVSNAGRRVSSPFGVRHISKHLSPNHKDALSVFERVRRHRAMSRYVDEALRSGTVHTSPRRRRRSDFRSEIPHTPRAPCRCRGLPARTFRN
jgi:hypothetical protein